ncbi:hypothetical protein AVEN_136201-1 [Araneus ventricosus]|uniref:Uncharacterized protein n=1 Tax=Araneus ventricosus TaxID=182803 RepID=A0A4Y2UCT3_ARAVE|nr:hypothetical protein AVEN_136201-1 [Araneus ventricosus]
MRHKKNGGCHLSSLHPLSNIQASICASSPHLYCTRTSPKLHPPSNKPLQAGYGLEKSFSQQEQILQNMKEEMNGMRVQGKKSLLPFQKGILISISRATGFSSSLKAASFSVRLLVMPIMKGNVETLPPSVGIQKPSPSKTVDERWVRDFLCTDVSFRVELMRRVKAAGRIKAK